MHDEIKESNNLAAGLADQDSEWWWVALHRGEFMLPRCRECETFFFPPTARCSHCGSPDVDKVSASGCGTIYSWVVIHHLFDPAFAGEGHAIVAAVDLEEGPRILARIVGENTLEAGLPVRICSYRVNGVAVPAFEVAD